MINQFASRQALKAQAEIAVTAAASTLNFDVNFIKQDDSLTLNTTSCYVVEYYMPTPVNSFGVGDDSSDYHNSLYQLTVYSPKSSGVNMNMLTAEKLKPSFSRGTILSSEGQDLKVKQVSQTKVTADDKHFITVLTINYFVSA